MKLTMCAEMGIEVKNLVKRYKEVLALDNVSLEVQKGSIVGLLGPNGAGKTTTLRILAGILMPTSGTLSICGYDGSQHPLAIKKRIGFISGDTQLYERLTVREILHFFGKLHFLDVEYIHERAKTLIADFDMSAFADRRIGTLSSGQTQRANIARILVHDPDVLILDEATVSLDIISSQFIMESLKSFKNAGKAILFSTHIMSEAEYLCDEIFLIYQGRILDRGTPVDLISKTRSKNLTDAFFSTMSAKDKKTSS